MTPKIDYALLGQALKQYQDRGYRYVEVPWLVEEQHLLETIPNPAGALVVCLNTPEGCTEPYLPAYRRSHLIGSAEQGFLSLDLEPGAYIGVTPCFRHEPKLDVFYQTGFVKAELFVTGESDSLDRVCGDAMEVMSLFSDESKIECVKTDEGYDLMMGGVEIGSYGERATQSNAARWSIKP